MRNFQRTGRQILGSDPKLRLGGNVYVVRSRSYKEEVEGKEEEDALFGKNGQCLGAVGKRKNLVVLH